MEKIPSVVADIMTSPVVTIDGESTVRDAALLMTEWRIGSIVITERGKPVGIVTKRDILERVVALCKDVCVTKMREVMSAPLITVTKKTGILEAMRKMREVNVGRLLVMEDGNLVGIVSERDLLRAVTIASLTSFSTLLKRVG